MHAIAEIQSVIKPPIAAAAYVRMSSDLQKYSIENQKREIGDYARRNNIEIVEFYEDVGRTGVTIRRRTALRRLIANVCERSANFSIILVFDVSRWGRFQDIDESAHYEFVCRRAGVAVEYCAEPFRNDVTLFSTLIKGIKRAAAAEFSRELSAKTFTSQVRALERGFLPGGTAGFGLRRMLIGPDNKPKQILQYGEQKSLQLDRVVLVPGPEQDIVREIFRLYAHDEKSLAQIAAGLNKRGVRSERGNLWSAGTVADLLHNERYIGNLVYNKVSSKLQANLKINAKSEWKRCVGAIEPVVDVDIFDKAQARFKRRRLSDNDLLNYLTATWCVNGHLSGKAVVSNRVAPSHDTFKKRFGSWSKAFIAVGFRRTYVRRSRGIGQACQSIERELVCALTSGNGSNQRAIRYDLCKMLLWVDNKISVRLRILPCLDAGHFSPGWWLRLNHKQRSDLILVVRLAPPNNEILDYFLLPPPVTASHSWNFGPLTKPMLLRWRLSGVEDFYERARSLDMKRR